MDTRCGTWSGVAALTVFVTAVVAIRFFPAAIPDIVPASIVWQGDGPAKAVEYARAQSAVEAIDPDVLPLLVATLLLGTHGTPDGGEVADPAARWILAEVKTNTSRTTRRAGGPAALGWCASSPNLRHLQAARAPSCICVHQEPLQRP